MDIVKIFALNVRSYRARLGLSQELLAEKCGMHRTYISGIECCRRSISLKNIQKIADNLHVEVYRLFIDNSGEKK
ncbi:helix-turn-helix transcriptional regulator [uncultured Desulfovibrio sp.]|uniref:helix-turn-helix domain-containing protein n=1 Tax=uncultured Desulfovibrio sp. TaxID=167968 RepID=UPI00260C1C3F|nr:helix-turn-helix transcriptional regulator [uncultured Desulfovibrio sp.]